jgi:hypothetical protein
MCIHGNTYKEREREMNVEQENHPRLVTKEGEERVWR